MLHVLGSSCLVVSAMQCCCGDYTPKSICSETTLAFLDKLQLDGHALTGCCLRSLQQQGNAFQAVRHVLGRLLETRAELSRIVSS